MRILFVLHQFYPGFSGGTEKVTLNLARAAQRAGHFVQILTCQVDSDNTTGCVSNHLSNARETTYQGVPIMLLPRNSLPASADFSLEVEATWVDPLVGWIQQMQFDVGHVMHTMRMSTVVLAIQKSNLPFILTLTDFFLACPRINLVNLDNKICVGPELGKQCGQDCLSAPWTREALIDRFDDAHELVKSASERIAPSGFVANRYRKIFPDCNFRVIEHGIDLLSLTGSRLAGLVTQGEKTKLRLGYVGGIIPQKGLDTLLRALARVKNPGIELKVIGGFHGATTFHNKVLSLCKSDPRVEVLGHLEPLQVFEAMQQFDLLCLPSRVPETFSLALHEAMACGVPALVSNLGAPSDLVKRHGAGEVLAFDDISAWENAIRAAAERPEIVSNWKIKLPLPLRVEEEGFYYDSLYRTLAKPI